MCYDKKSNWRRCTGVLGISLVTGIVSIPFLITFGVEFADGKNFWIENNREIQIPGDFYLYFALIMLNFSWGFGCIYYSMTLDAKEYEFDYFSPQLNNNNNGRKNEAFKMESKDIEMSSPL